ncbi:hypothetical protein GGI43DRAFT_416182, partial [Trichoderma evansii]
MKASASTLILALHAWALAVLAAPITDESSDHSSSLVQRFPFWLECRTVQSDRTCRQNGVARCSDMGTVQSVLHMCQDNCTCYYTAPCHPACAEEAEVTQSGGDGVEKTED